MITPLLPRELSAELAFVWWNQLELATLHGASLQSRALATHQYVSMTGGYWELTKMVTSLAEAFMCRTSAQEPQGSLAN